MAIVYQVYSNTTLVKVKLFFVAILQIMCRNSNTTLVKVKYYQEMQLRQANNNSNTTLVKVKSQGLLYAQYL